MDMLRSCYRTTMQLSFNRQDRTEVQWFFADDNAEWFPYFTPFRSLNYWDRKGDINTLGEVYGATRKWVDGERPARYIGRPFTGSEAEWQEGLSTDSVRHLETDNAGEPIDYRPRPGGLMWGRKCGPCVPGGMFGGSVLVNYVPAGGARIGGQVNAQLRLPPDAGGRAGGETKAVKRTRGTGGGFFAGEVEVSYRRMGPEGGGIAGGDGSAAERDLCWAHMYACLQRIGGVDVTFTPGGGGSGTCADPYTLTVGNNDRALVATTATYWKFNPPSTGTYYIKLHKLSGDTDACSNSLFTFNPCAGPWTLWPWSLPFVSVPCGFGTNCTSGSLTAGTDYIVAFQPDPFGTFGDYRIEIGTGSCP